MIDIESLTVQELEQLRDACNRRLLQMRHTEGLTLAELLRLLEEVKGTLNDQGKQWRSLERWQWIEGKIRFWLNPTDQSLYQTGWYSIDELIAWTQDCGPVLIEQEDEEHEEETWTSLSGVRIAWLRQGIGEEDVSEVETV